MHTPSKPANTAIVVVAIDGLATFKSGIGSIVHWFFEAIDQIVDKSASLSQSDWSLYAVCPDINRDADYSAPVHRRVENACKRYRGEFKWFEVEDNTNLKTVWSLDRMDRWRTMAANAASCIRNIAALHPRVTVIAHGTMFATLRANLLDQDNVQIVYITHTLGRVFLDANSPNRIAYEDEGFAKLHDFPQDKIGYVGSYYKDVLLDDYGRPPHQLVPFENSVLKESFRFRAVSPEPGQFRALEKAGIPLNNKLMFSWGRCVPQKGFDVIIPAFGRFLANREDADQWHLVLLMPEEVASADYTSQLRAALSLLPRSSYTAISSFEDALPYELLQHPSLNLAIFASRFEAGPLTLIEALAFGHAGLRIVWHKIAPMQHLLASQPVTFDFPNMTPQSMGDAMEKAANYQGTGIEKANIASFSANMATGIDSTLKAWDQEKTTVSISS